MRLGALVVCCFVTASISLRIPSIEACELREGEAVPTLIFPHKNLAATSAENHVFSIIQLALKSTENKYGPCEARLWETELPLQRMELYLEKTKKIDALALTANKTRDKRFLPVKVPVNKGMVGIRVALIRKGEQYRFNSIHSLNDLKPLVAGQGQNWIDAQILRANGLQVVTAASTASLIKMLTQHRFDYFPWGAMEIVPELSPYFANQVDIEQKIIISYPSITVLYVKPDAQQLAARLEHGLKNLFANGNFDRLFFSHPTIKSVLNTLKLDKRRIMQLCNPLMVEWVPTGVDTYWLFPWSEHIRGSECKAKFLPAQ